MEKLTFQFEDVILEDIAPNQGKIIITNAMYGAFHSSWGSMGGTIREFLCRVNAQYFADCLCIGGKYTFCGKQTAKNIRQYIRNEIHELPWYKYMEHQKELRGIIKRIEGSTNEHEALSLIKEFTSIWGVDSSYDECKEFGSIMEDHFDSEPWHFLGEKTTRQYDYLYDLHGRLKEGLKKMAA